MHKPAGPAWNTISLGLLPVEVINAKLGLCLVPGRAVFFAEAQKHAFEKVPDRFSICWEHLELTATQPTHIGQQPSYIGVGFDLVRVVPDGPIILIGIGMTPAKRGGGYPVKSCYPISRDALERRIRLGASHQI